jgi:hypothetical protein
MLCIGRLAGARYVTALVRKFDPSHLVVNLPKSFEGSPASLTEIEHDVTNRWRTMILRSTNQIHGLYVRSSNNQSLLCTSGKGACNPIAYTEDFRKATSLQVVLRLQELLGLA